MEKMEKSRKLDNDKKVLDLREWWKQIDKQDVERVMSKKNRWSYWRFSKDKTWVTTLHNWKITNYKANEVEVLFVGQAKKISNVKQEAKSEVLMDLLLSPDNQVKCTADAYEKARWSDKTNFWFISKWKRKAVIVLDFSKWKKPKISSYPLDKYNLKMKAVEV